MKFSPFRTAWKRVDRAEFHAKELAKFWNDSDAQSCYTTRIKANADGTWEIIVSPVDPDWLTDFTLQLGEFLYHLRSALDSCIYDIAVLQLSQGIIPPPNQSKWLFPIGATPEKFKKLAPRIEKLSDEVRAFIESVQPYHDLNVSQGEDRYSLTASLGFLNEWARIDRHRMLHAVGTLPAAGGVRIHCPDGMEVEYINYTIGGCLEDHNKIATFKVSNFRPGADVHVETSLEFKIAVNEVESIVIATDATTASLLSVIAVIEGLQKAAGAQYP